LSNVLGAPVEPPIVIDADEGAAFPPDPTASLPVAVFGLVDQDVPS